MVANRRYRFSVLLTVPPWSRKLWELKTSKTFRTASGITRHGGKFVKFKAKYYTDTSNVCFSCKTFFYNVKYRKEGVKKKWTTALWTNRRSLAQRRTQKIVFARIKLPLQYAYAHASPKSFLLFSQCPKPWFSEWSPWNDCLYALFALL